jgi:hypothetical protein
MRRLIESLTPQARQLYWKWVGGIFALYVVLLLTAASVFVSHESPRKLAQEPVTTVAVRGNVAVQGKTTRSIAEVAVPIRQAARD